MKHRLVLDVSGSVSGSSLGKISGVSTGSLAGLARAARAAVLVVLIASALGKTTEALAQPAQRRFATLAPRGSAWMKLLMRGAAEIEKQTGGRVVPKYYPSGTMGDERDMVRKLRLGQIDGASVTGVGLALIDASIRVLELPRLFASVEELDYVRDRMWPYFQKKLEKQGFILLSHGEVGWVHLYASKPVRSLAELRKLKPWMWTDDAIIQALYKKLGMRGVPMGVPDVLPSLTSGRINAVYSSPLAAVAMQWNTQVKHVLATPLSVVLSGTIMTKKAWDQTSEADRQAIGAIFQLQSSKLTKTIRQGNDTAHRHMVRKGIAEVAIASELEHELDKAAQAVWQELVGKVYSQEELDMVLRYRDEYRAKRRK